jgi:hypothetical protein
VTEQFEEFSKKQKENFVKSHVQGQPNRLKFDLIQKQNIY